jgi:hypothetical protein
MQYPEAGPPPAQGAKRTVELSTRLRIVGVEVVGLGAFVLLLAYFELREAGSSGVVESFTWVWAIVGITLALVGLEILALARQIAPAKP